MKIPNTTNPFFFFFFRFFRRDPSSYLKGKLPHSGGARHGRPSLQRMRHKLIVVLAPTREGNLTSGECKKKVQDLEKKKKKKNVRLVRHFFIPLFEQQTT
jgi:hypothetical protein